MTVNKWVDNRITVAKRAKILSVCKAEFQLRAKTECEYSHLAHICCLLYLKSQIQQGLVSCPRVVGFMQYCTSLVGESLVEAHTYWAWQSRIGAERKKRLCEWLVGATEGRKDKSNNHDWWWWDWKQHGFNQKKILQISTQGFWLSSVPCFFHLLNIVN